MSLQEIEKKYKQAVKNYNLLLNLPGREESLKRAWYKLVSLKGLMKIYHKINNNF